MKTKCARCGERMKSNGGKWGVCKKCETGREKQIAQKLNKRIINPH